MGLVRPLHGSPADVVHGRILQVFLSSRYLRAPRQVIRFGQNLSSSLK